MVRVIMLNVVNAECYYAKCHYTECYYAECHGAFLKGRGKITLLLSARFCCLFIAIKWKHRSLHYTFNGTFIKITYNNAYRNSNHNGNYGVNV
jgi:hypothetical protein